MGPLAKLDLFGYGRHLRIALVKFDRLVERIIKEHEEKKMKGTERSEGMDLMDILLEISRDPNVEMKLTKKEIKAFFLKGPNPFRASLVSGPISYKKGPGPRLRLPRNQQWRKWAGPFVVPIFFLEISDHVL
ncbi:hypothetical protein OIU85_000400 [Salix viminalis]|uniref:Uncharacterized protein n=1 Tax=Salix viminalis TaxID=40686 RepID=A0A9Q0VJ38_SALVM|nr:hypothetical protein OIU85_000400 [Salix viminalis]